MGKNKSQIQWPYKVQKEMKSTHTKKKQPNYEEKKTVVYNSLTTTKNKQQPG